MSMEAGLNWHRTLPSGMLLYASDSFTWGEIFPSSFQELLCFLDLAVLHEETTFRLHFHFIIPFLFHSLYHDPLLLSSFSCASSPEHYHTTKFSSLPARVRTKISPSLLANLDNNHLTLYI